MNKFKEQLASCGKEPLFEIPVIDKRTNESDYILCEIQVNKYQFEAVRVAFNELEEKSNLIAFDSVDIDPDFSLDWHLQELYDEVVNSILKSEFYQLSE